MRTVTSRDGTRIAYERTGAGPPIVFVHGGWDDHTAWRQVLPMLAQQFTVYAMDRRGCGESDAYRDDYAVEHDLEDVATIIDMIGEPAHLVGHSIGGCFALHGALLTPNVRSLVIYEPPLGGPELTPTAVLDRIEALVAAGDRDGAAVVFVHEVVGVPRSDLEHQRASPTWSLRVAGIHAVPPGLRAFSRFRFDPERLRALHVPTLLLVGSETTTYHKEAVATVAEALPDAQIAVLPGQRHNANITAPDLLAAEILRFLTAHGRGSGQTPTATC
jgi:pimeloyl-ACP methyl ester carboxylesterase